MNLINFNGLLVWLGSAAHHVRHCHRQEPRNERADAALHADAVVHFTLQLLPLLAGRRHQEVDRPGEGGRRCRPQSHFRRPSTRQTLRHHRLDRIWYVISVKTTVA